MAVEEKDSSFKDIKRIGKLSHSGVFIYHLAEKRFVFLNSALVKILEINKRLLLEEPGLIFKSMDEEDRQYLKIRIAELIEKQSLEDVQIRWVQHKTRKVLSCNCYLAADRSWVTGFVKDISKPKQHDDYMANFGARKDAILDAVSQRLSTPLNLSRFTLDLIEKAVQEKKFHRLDAHIALIREVTGECIKVIDELLRQEHLESPAIYTKATRFDLVGKVLVVLDKMKELNPDRRFKFKSDVRHLLITGDDVKFFQVVHNIISNAIKFTRPNGRIAVAIRNHASRVEITVEDDGIGIPDDLKPFVFEKNSRAGRPGLRGESSAGVGLFVAKRLTELQNGKISFESNENEGTRFTLEFPKN